MSATVSIALCLLTAAVVGQFDSIWRTCVERGFLDFNLYSNDDAKPCDWHEEIC